jgi:hypothetical protein
MAKLIDTRQIYTIRLKIELDEDEIKALYHLMDNHDANIELDELWEIIRPYGDKDDIPF